MVTDNNRPRQHRYPDSVPDIPEHHEGADFGALATKPHNEDLFRVFDTLNEDAWIDCNKSAVMDIDQ